MYEKVAVEKPVRGRELTTKNVDGKKDLASDPQQNKDIFYKAYKDDKEYLIPDSSLQAMADLINLKMRVKRSAHYRHETSFEKTDYDILSDKLNSLVSKMTELNSGESSSGSEESIRRSSEYSFDKIPEENTDAYLTESHTDQEDHTTAEDSDLTKDLIRTKSHNEVTEEKEKEETSHIKSLEVDKVNDLKKQNKKKEDSKTRGGKEASVSDELADKYDNKRTDERQPTIIQERRMISEEKDEKLAELEKIPKYGKIEDSENYKAGILGKQPEVQKEEVQPDKMHGREELEGTGKDRDKTKMSEQELIRQELTPDSDEIESTDERKARASKLSTVLGDVSEDEEMEDIKYKQGKLSKQLKLQEEREEKRHLEEKKLVDSKEKKGEKILKVEESRENPEYLKMSDPYVKTFLRPTPEDLKSKQLEMTKLEYEIKDALKKPLRDSKSIENKHLFSITDEGDVYRLRLLISGHIKSNDKLVYLTHNYNEESDIFRDQKANFFSSKKEGNVDINVSGKLYKKNILEEIDGKPVCINTQSGIIPIDSERSKLFQDRFEVGCKQSEFDISIKGKFIESTPNNITPLISIEVLKNEVINKPESIFDKGDPSTVLIYKPYNNDPFYHSSRTCIDNDDQCTSLSDSSIKSKSSKENIPATELVHETPSRHPFHQGKTAYTDNEDCTSKSDPSTKSKASRGNITHLLNSICRFIKKKN